MGMRTRTHNCGKAETIFANASGRLARGLAGINLSNVPKKTMNTLLSTHVSGPTRLVVPKVLSNWHITYNGCRSLGEYRTPSPRLNPPYLFSLPSTPWFHLHSLCYDPKPGCDQSHSREKFDGILEERPRDNLELTELTVYVVVAGDEDWLRQHGLMEDETLWEEVDKAKV